MELEETFKLMQKTDPTYYKGYLNHASFVIRNIRKELKLPILSTLPDYGQYSSEPTMDCRDCLIEIDKALKEIDKCKSLKPNFVNGYYKTAEALILKIWLMRELRIKDELFLCVNQCREKLEYCPKYLYESFEYFIL